MEIIGDLSTATSPGEPLSPPNQPDPNANTAASLPSEQKRVAREPSNPLGPNRANRQTSDPPGEKRAEREAYSGIRVRVGLNINSKRRGEAAEAGFLHRASLLGFSVAKPWGESDRYDFIVENGAHAWRVQVKSSYSDGRGGYTIHAAGHFASRIYTEKEVDFLAAYIAAEDLWYIMPIGLFKTMNSIRLHPSARHGLSRFEKYREAWCLMACPKDGQCRSELQILRCCEREGAELRCPKGP